MQPLLNTDFYSYLELMNLKSPLSTYLWACRKMWAFVTIAKSTWLVNAELEKHGWQSSESKAFVSHQCNWGSIPRLNVACEYSWIDGFLMCFKGNRRLTACSTLNLNFWQQTLTLNVFWISKITLSCCENWYFKVNLLTSMCRVRSMLKNDNPCVL